MLEYLFSFVSVLHLLLSFFKFFFDWRHDQTMYTNLVVVFSCHIWINDREICRKMNIFFKKNFFYTRQCRSAMFFARLLNYRYMNTTSLFWLWNFLYVRNKRSLRWNGMHGISQLLFSHSEIFLHQISAYDVIYENSINCWTNKQINRRFSQ